MINWSKIKLPAAALLVLGLASYVVFLEVEASENSDELIGPSAVWEPAANDMDHIQQICQPHGENYSHCFIEQMASLGASDDAVAFTRNYAGQNHGTIAFLRDFRPVDSVDLGYAFFPANADLGQAWLLVNGDPAIINVDDLSLLPLPEMMKDPVYAALLKRHPKITLFGDERGTNIIPDTETLPDGSQSFLVEYQLKDQCRACGLLGRASFRFDFDSSGRFSGIKFQKIAAAGM